MLRFLRRLKNKLVWGNSHAIGVLPVYRHPSDILPFAMPYVMEDQKYCNHATRVCDSDFCFSFWNFAAFPDWKSSRVTKAIFDKHIPARKDNK